MLAGYVLKEMLTATSVHLLNIYSVIINWRYNLKYGFLPGATSDFQSPLEKELVEKTINISHFFVVPQKVL